MGSNPARVACGVFSTELYTRRCKAKLNQVLPLIVLLIKVYWNASYPEPEKQQHKIKAYRWLISPDTGSALTAMNTHIASMHCDNGGCRP